jgi:hypothetical protein
MTMTMFNRMPTILIVVLSTGYILSTRAEVPLCFYPDTSQAQSDHACNLTAEVSFCCAIGDKCLDNKLCITDSDDPQVVQPYNRGSCTDKTWNSPECPRFCLDFSSDGGTWLVDCGDQGVCCYDVLADRPEDCCSANSSAQNPVLTLDGEATAFTLIENGAATQTRIMPSSSSSTTATTTTPTSSTSSAVADSPSPTPAAASNSSPDSTLTTGAYVGIAIGIAVAIALLCVAAYVFRKRRGSKQQTDVLMPLVGSSWNNSPGFTHGKEQSEIHELQTSEVAELNGLTAEHRAPELRAETLLELEGSNERR